MDKELILNAILSRYTDEFGILKNGIAQIERSISQHEALAKITLDDNRFFTITIN